MAAAVRWTPKDSPFVALSWTVHASKMRRFRPEPNVRRQDLPQVNSAKSQRASKSEDENMLGYFLLIVLTSSSYTQNDLDPDLIVCFESVSKLKTLRFKSTLYSNRFTRVSPNQKSLDGLWEAKNAEGIIDLPSGWFRFKESMYDDKHGKCLNRSRSWCDGELRAFTDINSPILEAANLVAPGGTIDLEPLDYAALPPVPRSQLGFGVTAVAGDLADLWDLAIQNPPVKIRENTYEIRNVFGWKPDFGSAYDLYFELSPQHGYLPRLIKILDRTLDGSVPTTTLLEREVNRFAKINSFVLPVDFTYRVGKTVERTILDHDSLVINETFSKDDFALQMPIDNWYYDYRTKTRFEPKVLGPTKASWTWIWLIAGAGFVTLTIVFLKLRKRT
jgi:hypothetical protein